MHPSIHPVLSYASCLRKMPMISWTSWSTNNFSLQVNCVSHLFIDFQILYVLDKWCFEVILHLYNSIGMEDQIHWLHFDALRGRIGEVDSREMAIAICWHTTSLEKNGILVFHSFNCWHVDNFLLGLVYWLCTCM